jgi:S1-C subfamily serine protease
MTINFKRLCFYVSFLLIAQTADGIAVEIGGTNFTVGSWQGSAYIDDQTKTFSHCMGSGGYLNGTGVFVSQAKDAVWTLAFMNDQWSLPVGQTKSVYLNFDNKGWKEYQGLAFEANFLVLDMGISGAGFSGLFRKARIMQLRFDDLSYNFDLSNTSKLLDQISACVRLHSPRATTAEKTAQPPAASEYPPPIIVAEAPAEKSAAAQEVGPQSELDQTPSTGTGIIISSQGEILTNNHVVKGCTSLSYVREGELARSVNVLRMDEANDLAVLKADVRYDESNVGSFRAGKSLRAGEEIVVYGFPLTGLLSQSGNVVSGNVSSLAGIGDDARYYQITAPVQPGNSGGPLLDYAGNVVGVVNSQLDAIETLKLAGSIPQNVNFAIKSNIAMNFLDTHGVDYNTAGDSAGMKIVDVAQKAKRFTVNIVCYRK